MRSMKPSTTVSCRRAPLTSCCGGSTTRTNTIAGLRVGRLKIAGGEQISPRLISFGPSAWLRAPRSPTASCGRPPLIFTPDSLTNSFSAPAGVAKPGVPGRVKPPPRSRFGAKARRSDLRCGLGCGRRTEPHDKNNIKSCRIDLAQTWRLFASVRSEMRQQRIRRRPRMERLQMHATQCPMFTPNTHAPKNLLAISL